MSTLIKVILFSLLQGYQVKQMRDRHDFFDKHNFSMEPLYDMVHHNTRMVHTSPFILNSLLLAFWSPCWFKNCPSTLFSTYLDIWLTLMIVRSITTIVTALPPSKPKCDEKHHPIFGGCFDKIFSGHTMTALLTVLVLYQFNIVSPSMYYWWISLAALYGFLLVVSRDHYTIDVLISFVLTYAVFRLQMP